MHFISYSPHVTHHVTTPSCVVTYDMTFYDNNVTPFPYFTFIVVIQLNKWK